MGKGGGIVRRYPQPPIVGDELGETTGIAHDQRHFQGRSFQGDDPERLVRTGREKQVAGGVRGAQTVLVHVAEQLHVVGQVEPGDEISKSSGLTAGSH